MTATVKPPTAGESHQFGAVLEEAKAELDDAEARDQAFAHVERLSHAAHQTLLALIGSHLPRLGGHAYRVADAPPLRTATTALDIRY